MPHYFCLRNEEIEEYIAQHGPASTGKLLACVFEFLDSDTVIPVTAYEVDDET